MPNLTSSAPARTGSRRLSLSKALAAGLSALVCADGAYRAARRLDRAADADLPDVGLRRDGAGRVLRIGHDL